MFVIGGYVNVKGKAKGIVCIALCICLLGSCVVANVAGLDDGSLYLVDSNEGVLAVASDGEGNYLVVSNCTTVGDVQKIVDRLSRFRVNSLSLAFTCYRKVNVNALQLLMDKYHVDNAYVFDGTGNDVVDAMLIRNQTKAVVVPPNNPIPLLDAKIVADGVPLGLALCCKHVSFVIVYDTSDVLLARLAQLVDADVVYSAAYLPMLETRFAKSVVLFGEDTKGGHKNSLTECGNFTICSKSGTIKVTNGGGM
ncbi:MAG: hypothetical protein IKC47_01990 [Clostridia bacterium]|nr:hypothetical protein [Clostridia bacterium]